MRVVALTARSRFTGEEGAREPRLVRRRVSGDTPTVKWVGVKAVMVRHVPGVWGDGLAEGGGMFSDDWGRQEGFGNWIEP